MSRGRVTNSDNARQKGGSENPFGQTSFVNGSLGKIPELQILTHSAALMSKIVWQSKIIK
jgi:hypothetical protein